MPACSETLPDAPGLYRLWFDLDQDVSVRVGARGEVSFAAGRYGYTGSARSGIRARVARHLRGGGALRWHLDYLLPHGRVVHVEAHPTPDMTECALNAQGATTPEASFPAPGFGSSDCRCRSHLVRVPRWMPVPLVAHVPLRSGQRAAVRLLGERDAAALGSYFVGLSDRTKSRYGPHAFDLATAQAICASLDPHDMLCVIATVGAGASERIIAYMLVKLGVRESDGARYAALGIPLSPPESAALAPSVADAYQNQGLGGAMFASVAAMARSVGVRRLVLWDGVIADNLLAQGFYRKVGFAKVGEFQTGVLSHDMIADLNGLTP
jgi:Uri superfamily endonuclease/ribosomal protein S18 acetylase RimI-like enzyme